MGECPTQWLPTNLLISFFPSRCTVGGHWSSHTYLPGMFCQYVMQRMSLSERWYVCWVFAITYHIIHIIMIKWTATTNIKFITLTTVHRYLEISIHSSNYSLTTRIFDQIKLSPRNHLNSLHTPWPQTTILTWLGFSWRIRESHNKRVRDDTDKIHWIWHL